MSTAEKQRPAPGALVLDHVSHFVPDLDAAAAVLADLGFVVTQRSDQQTPEGPVGAANRCVMLDEGYLEILAPTLETPTAQRMRAAMARHVGVHLACFGTPDAEGEHRRLADHGFEPQPLVDLRREAEGRPVRFKVVRPAPEKMPEGRVQYVEQMTPEAIWTPAHLAHGNGVQGLSAVFVVADDPLQVAARWARFSALLPRREGALLALETARGRVLIGTREIIAGILGHAPAAPSIAGYALSCADPGRFAALCAESALAVRRSGRRFAVALPPALGGAWLLQQA